MPQCPMCSIEEDDEQKMNDHKAEVHPEAADDSSANPPEAQQ